MNSISLDGLNVKLGSYGIMELPISREQHSILKTELAFIRFSEVIQNGSSTYYKCDKETVILLDYTLLTINLRLASQILYRILKVL